MNEERIHRFVDALSGMLLRMQEIDSSCMELTKDISKRDFALLIYLGQTGPKIMSEAAEFMNIPMSTATSVVDKLVEKNYVERVNSPEDRRIIKIQLNKNGQAIYDLLQEKMFHFGTVVLSNFSDEKQEQFIQFLSEATIGLQKESFNRSLKKS